LARGVMALAARRKKPAAKRAAEKHHKRFEVSGLVLIALGVFLFVSNFTASAGAVGEWLYNALFGIVGFAGYVIPFLLVALGFYIILRGRRSIGWQNAAVWSLFFVCTIALIHIFMNRGDFTNSTGDFYNDFFAITGKAFDHGRAGGGWIGGTIVFLISALIGPVGTIIVLILLLLVILVLKTGFSVRKLTTKVGENVKSIGEAFAVRREERGYDEAPPQRSGRLFVDNLDGREIERNRKKPELSLLNATKFETAAQHTEEKDSLLFGKEGLEDFHAPLKPQQAAQQGTQQGAQQATIFDQLPEDQAKALKKAGTDGDAKPVIKPEHREYVKPPFNLLTKSPRLADNSAEEINRGAMLLEDTLMSFGINSKVVNVSRGPSITRYELQPAPGIKISRIVNLSNDIAMSMAAPGVRIEAPIPGKAAIGVEVPNTVISIVKLRDVLEGPEFTKTDAALSFCLGKDIAGKSIVADLSKMPHLLIAGATGSGKSVCINTMIVSILYKSSPEQVRMIMIDPKVVELNVYNGVPHLLIPVVTDPKKAAGALNWAVQEMMRRYALFADKGARDLHRYNELISDDEEAEKLSQIVIVVDELADLMMTAPNEVEDAIFRLAQMARAAGMHLVIATQRPSVDVITGVIKANIPSRIAFAVSSQVDSRTILDIGGAEKLLGRGDMLFNPSGANKPLRIQGAYITENEVEKVVEFIRQQGQEAEYDDDVLSNVNSYELPGKKGRGSSDENGGDDEYSERKYDALLKDAAEVVFETGQASISMVQRRLRVGYARAARLVDEMEELGIVSPSTGSKPRDIMKSKLDALQVIEQYSK
jgi:S-DNA-T family DNA segregation ATPase FtsK/SpoIIIE